MRRDCPVLRRNGPGCNTVPGPGRKALRGRLRDVPGCLREGPYTAIFNRVPGGWLLWRSIQAPKNGAPGLTRKCPGQISIPQKKGPAPA